MTNNIAYPALPFAMISGKLTILVQMFLDQNHSGRSSRGSSNPSQVAVMTLPFKQWVVGHIVATQTNLEEEWKIHSVKDDAGNNLDQLRRDDCVVGLVNKANETRSVKGSTLQSSYRFVGVGDVEPPKIEAATTAVTVRPDCRPLAIAVDGIREFYPRTAGEGTRVLMHDKTAYIVADHFFSIWDAYAIAGKADQAAVSGREHK